MCSPSRSLELNDHDHSYLSFYLSSYLSSYLLLTSLYHHPPQRRVKRVNLRDLQFLLEQEKSTVRSSLLYRMYAK